MAPPHLPPGQQRQAGHGVHPGLQGPCGEAGPALGVLGQSPFGDGCAGAGCVVARAFLVVLLHSFDRLDEVGQCVDDAHLFLKAVGDPGPVDGQDLHRGHGQVLQQTVQGEVAGGAAGEAGHDLHQPTGVQLAGVQLVLVQLVHLLLSAAGLYRSRRCRRCLGQSIPARGIHGLCRAHRTRLREKSAWPVPHQTAGARCGLSSLSMNRIRPALSARRLLVWPGYRSRSQGRPASVMLQETPASVMLGRPRGWPMQRTRWCCLPAGGTVGWPRAEDGATARRADEDEQASSH